MFKKKVKNYTIIIGCGMLGAKIADTLSNQGEDVLVIDKDQDSIKRLSSNFGGLTIIGNGLDLDILKEAKIESANTVLAVTNDDNINIMAAQIAKDVYKVESVIARLYDPDRELIYKKLGIITICPAELSAKEIGKVLYGLQTQEKTDEKEN